MAVTAINGRLRKADSDADEDPGQLAQAIDQVLDAAQEQKDAGNDEEAWALVRAAAAAIDSLQDALAVPDLDEDAEGTDVQKAMAGTKRVGAPMPSRYENDSPVPMMDPEDTHAFIAHAKNPDKCVACGKSLGHDLHWQTAPVYKDEGQENDGSFMVLPEQDNAVWVAIEKEEGGKLRGLVYGVVLHPTGNDAHGDEVTPEEIEKAAHGWMRKSRELGDQHFVKAGADVVESYIAPVTFRVKRPDGSQATVPKGAWVAVTKVEDSKLLRDIVTGKKSGYSIGGTGVREPVQKDWVKWDEARKSGHLSRATAHAALTAAGFDKQGTNASGYHVYEHGKDRQTRAKVHEHDGKTHVIFEHAHGGTATVHSMHSAGSSTPLDVYNGAHQALAEAPVGA